MQFKDIITKELKDWINEHSLLCKVPHHPLIYSPKRKNSFSYQGEAMVESLTKIGPIVCNIFQQFFSLDEQKEIVTNNFNSLKGTKHDKPGKKGEPGYFKTNRKFGSLTPTIYSRTVNAPRLTAKGNSFHGMNKVLLIEIVKELTKRIHSLFIIELDMSACHSRVAGSLLKRGNTLEEALEAPNFWEKQVNFFLPMYLEKGIEVSPKQLKKMLKVFLYTSLNGGNPASHDRLIDNLTGNAMNLLPKKKINESTIYQITKKIAEDFQLIKEVKDLNTQCFNQAHYHSYTFTVDKAIPYANTASYKGISRVLQGFEVVLLCPLTLSVVQMNGLPLSLDHDGLMAAFIIEDSSSIYDKIDVEDVRQIEHQLTQSILPWSNYLLNGNVPIEAKRHWFRGEVVEY